ncbi:MAG: hypothetical protein ACREMC_08595, partial [Gemmatimonadales bacterium]
MDWGGGRLARRLATLRREAQREWRRRSKARAPGDWRLTAAAILHGLLRLLVIIALPFIVLVRGAVFFYEHGQVPTWLALLVAG